MEWISINDELPIPYERVIIYVDGSNHFYKSFIDIGDYSPGNGSFIWTDSDGLSVNVTHWKRLPNPPEGE